MFKKYLKHYVLTLIMNFITCIILVSFLFILVEFKSIELVENYTWLGLIIKIIPYSIIISILISFLTFRDYLEEVKK